MCILISPSMVFVFHHYSQAAANAHADCDELQNSRTGRQNQGNGEVAAALGQDLAYFTHRGTSNPGREAPKHNQRQEKIPRRSPAALKETLPEVVHLRYSLRPRKIKYSTTHTNKNPSTASRNRCAQAAKTRNS